MIKKNMIISHGGGAAWLMYATFQAAKEARKEDIEKTAQFELVDHTRAVVAEKALHQVEAEVEIHVEEIRRRTRCRSGGGHVGSPGRVSAMRRAFEKVGHSSRVFSKPSPEEMPSRGQD